MRIHKNRMWVISAILLLSIAGSALADTSWTNGAAGDRSWDNASNWDAGIPISTVKTGVRQSGDGPIIDAGTTATTKELVVGDWGHTDSVNITGGTLTTSGWFILGYGGSDDGTFNVDGGNTTINSHMDVGFNGHGNMDMTNGTVTVTGAFGISMDDNGLGTSSGDVQLDGGTISCGSFIMKSGSSMDITGGTLIVNGNVASTIDGYISSGWITAHGGSGTLTVDPTINPGKTTVTAFMPTEPPTKATVPIPAHNATDVSINPTLSWLSGLNTSSHDIYFGTDSTPDVSEFQDNRTNGTFNPGTLSLSTTYYWRIDEKNAIGTATGDVWSFTTTDDTGYSLIGKVMCGYQGWFNAPGDGTNFGFRHWGQNGNFTPVDCSVDFWPDMTEYTAGEKYLVSSFNDGTDHYVFSSHNQATVVRHFKWMYDYGIDGVYVQRFMTETSPGSPIFNERNNVLDFCKAGANLYGRKYAVMYDLSSKEIYGPEVQQRVEDDWKYLVDTMQVGRDATDDAYMTHNGKPVVAVWGLGFNRIYEGAESRDLIEFLKNDPVYGGNIVMLGVNDTWSANTNTYFQQTLQIADIISPWMVGRPNDTAQVTAWANGNGRRDKDWCDDNNKEYLPVIFPGFSWYNHKDYASTLNDIPRHGGQFLWDQVNACVNTLGVNMMYVAMFDEVDEGTAIFKVTNDPPVVPPSVFLTPDYDGYDIPSDEYLWLVGQAAKGLRGEIPVNPTRPERTGCAGPADFDCDGDIDGDDISYMAIRWLTADTTADIALPKDGTVNLLDFVVFWQEWSIANQPVAYLKLDETAGVVAADASTNAYDGTLVNMDSSDWVPGNTGNALDFDGINDYVTVDGVCLALAGWDITISAWVKAPATNSNMQFMIAINTSTGDNRLLCGTQPGSGTLSLADTAWYDTETTVIDNTWHHIAYVLDDSADTVTVYVDGSDVLSFASTVSVAADDVLSLGQEYDAGMITGDFYDGLLDDVRVYDRALTAAEINAIAQ